MRSDFINSREGIDRRNLRYFLGNSAGSTTTITDKELILVPSFNTFIWNNPAGTSGSDRWDTIGGQNPKGATELPIGLLNPWNDGDDVTINTPPFAPRTPTRSILGFNLSGLSADVNILSADLTMKVVKNQEWGNGAGSGYLGTSRSTSANVSTNLKNRMWVIYNFDGEPPSTYRYRAVGYGGTSPYLFSWRDFVNGTCFYNPELDQNQINPISLKRWYLWGQRNFQLHQPFGRPSFIPSIPAYVSRRENLAYQADAYLLTKDGFRQDDYPDAYVNLTMPWLLEDFTRIWKALITGDMSVLTTLERSQLNWFNPRDPITVIVYQGCISRLSENAENQYPRWNALFNNDYASALQRLKESVQPFIDCKMHIALDALAVAPGDVPGKYIPLSLLNAKAQTGWWEFYLWLKNQVGAENLYCEATQSLRYNLFNNRFDPSPYIGINAMSEEDWSYANPDTMSFNKLSTLGRVNFIRVPHWGLGPKTNRINSAYSPARYERLSALGVTATDGEIRLVVKAENNYHNGIWHEIIKTNLMEKFQQEQDPQQDHNMVIDCIGIPPTLLQAYPASGFTGSQRSFISKFPTINHLIQWLDPLDPDSLIEASNANAIITDNTAI